MKNIHFIGIAGSAIAPLAIMLKQKGYNITGSEHNKVWEPAKSLLKNNDIIYTELEYNLNNIKNADLVVLGGSALLKDSEHPEYIEAKKLNKKIVGYAYIVKKFITKKNSIVVSGSYGKTTITSLLIHIFKYTNQNPSFMVGGKPIGFKKGVKSTESDISIVEGDEYASAWGFDMEPRFIHYKPTHAIITSAEWDHLDVYPTLKSYIQGFQKLTKLIKKKNGLLVVNAEGENISKVLQNFNGKLISYSTEKQNKLNTDLFYSTANIKYLDTGSKFDILENNEKLVTINSPLFGRFNIENMLAAFSISKQYGLKVNEVKIALENFKGIKRRLEYLTTLKTGAKVIDDFAHSPIKAKATLEALKKHFPDKKIIGIYNPRISIHQNKDILKLYPGVFDAADQIFITKLVQLKETEPENRIRAKDLLQVIKKTQPNVNYAAKDEIIADYLNKKTDKDSIVVLMSASSWNSLLKKLEILK